MANIDVAYHELLRDILDNGDRRGDRTGTGTISIFDAKIKHDMTSGFPLLTTKKVFTKGIITELLWFLQGDTNIKALVEQGNNIWVGDAYQKYCKSHERIVDALVHITPIAHSKESFIEAIKTDDSFAKKWGNLGPIYGKQWVNWERHGFRLEDYRTINQIQNVIDTLNNNPESRRIMVSAWNVGEIDRMTLPPCHWAFEFYTEVIRPRKRTVLAKEMGFELPSITQSSDMWDAWCDEHNIPKRKLSLKWHQRSVDTPLGLPFNIASYAFLLEMIAQQVNMQPYMLVGDLTNVHIYKNQLDGVDTQLSRDTSEYDAPRLVLNKAKNIFSYKYEDFKIEGYESGSTIKFPLSN